MDDWGSHFPALANCIVNTDGNVLEMGCGDYSTPMLHLLCKRTQRLLVSLDSDASWIDRFTNLRSDTHIVEVCNDWENCEWTKEKYHWDVVFIDHAPGERRIHDIMKLANAATYLVVHDTQAKIVYGYESVLDKFKYRYDYTQFATWTTILSNTQNPKDIF